MNKTQLLALAASSLAVAKQVQKDFSEAHPSEIRMSKDFEEKFDKAMADHDDATDRLEKLERLEKAEAAAKEVSNKIELAGGVPGNTKGETKESMEVLEKYLKFGNNRLTFEEKDILQGVGKAYETGNNAGGGYFVGEQIANMILTLVKDQVAVRGISNVLQVTNADSLGIYAIDTDPNDADWTAEIGTVTEDTALAAGKRELKPQLLSKLIKISMKLANASPQFVQMVMERLSYKFAVTEEKAFMTGTGVSRPLGVFTPSTAGIGTAYDNLTASAGVMIADDIIDTYFDLHETYAQRATWVFSRTVLREIRKLKASGTGEYIWVPDLKGGTQDILGRPFQVSSHAPAYSASANAYLAVFGDFSQFVIVDSLAMSIQKLEEMYSGTNQLGYIMRRELDAMPVQGEAFRRLQMQ